MKDKKVIIIVAAADDIDVIKKLADSHRKELGFVLRPALIESIEKQEVLVAKIEDQIVGFMHWHKRKDNWSTRYHLCVNKDFRGKGIGKMLVEAVPKPNKGKCPIDNESNKFFRKIGAKFRGTEPGKKRSLNIWVFE